MYCSLVQAWVSIIAIDLECLCLLCYNYSAALGIVETTKTVYRIAGNFDGGKF